MLSSYERFHVGVTIREGDTAEAYGMEAHKIPEREAEVKEQDRSRNAFAIMMQPMQDSGSEVNWLGVGLVWLCRYSKKIAHFGIALDKR
jgi:hypothetical protein